MTPVSCIPSCTELYRYLLERAVLRGKRKNECDDDRDVLE